MAAPRMLGTLARVPARTVVLVAAGWILVLHPLLDAIRAPLYVLGPLDWSAHLATAVLLLANLPRAPPPAFVAAALAASLAIDLDHVPGHLGAGFLSAGAPRPYAHSLGTVAAALTAAALTRGAARRVAGGIAFGVAAHLVRDLGTGGVPLLWPVTRAGVSVPFWLETAAVAALATRAWIRAGRSGRPG